MRAGLPRGRHNLAVGLAGRIGVTVEGNAGYFLGGLVRTKDGGGPDIVVDGFVGWSVGENLMGGTIRVRGSASQSAGASARGGRILIEGDASLRAGISLKGGTLAIAGDAGAMIGIHGPGRHHPHRRRRRARPGRLALRGRDLRRRARSPRSEPTPWSKR